MDRIGDYIAMEVLGEGASAIVRVGVHAVTKAKVALKIISHRKFEVGKNEISILASARHPSLVGLIDVFPWVSYTLCFLVLTRKKKTGEQNRFGS